MGQRAAATASDSAAPTVYSHRMMQYTQYLSFEFHPDCNLGDVHKACPNRHPERYAHVDTSRTLDDGTIVEVARRMHEEFGFRGLVAFHYYNEPLMQAARLYALVDAIREAVPRARFVLWSNGTLLTDELRPLRAFGQIYITDYGNLNKQHVDRLRQLASHVQICRWPLDGRTTAQDAYSIRPCGRMFVEFVVDFHGNVHLCCHDWRGLGSPGNVFKDDLATLVERWQVIRASISGAQMTGEAPETCLRCPMRQPEIGWEVAPEVVRDAKEHMRQLKQGG